ncbi:MAG TPA: hypothetical protein VMX58_07855, partial [Patescibacteria group bacterium]|nr:hypothetical protein [Patescibacteria group bacterium]
MKRIINKVLIVVFAAVALAVPVAPLSAGDLYRHVTLDSGIEATLCTPEAILEHLSVRDGEGRLIFRVPGGVSYLFIEEISDPAIINK